MSNIDSDTPSRNRNRPLPADPDAADEWPATRAFAASPALPGHDRRDEAGEPSGDIGRRTVPNEYELFVSCDPGPALQQQFEYLQPMFIAVHDIGTSSSRKLLQGVASASGRAMQKLVIRRQGYGTALATLHFVELPAGDGRLLRMYTTDCETESAWRAGIAHLLLAFSRLGVIMVGDLQALAINPALKPLREVMTAGAWPNRHLLLLPLSSANNLVAHGMELARGTPVNVRTTPQVARPADAWGFISGSWGRANSALAASDRAAVGLNPLFANGKRPQQPATRVPTGNSDAADSPDTAPGVLALAAGATDTATINRSARTHTGPGRLVEPAHQVGVKPTAGSAPESADLMRRYARQISEFSGVGSCCVFDIASKNSIAYSGTGPGATALAAHGAELISAIAGHGRQLKLGDSIAEAAITLGMHHLLLRAVPRHPALGMIAMLDRASANLTMVRLQVLRLDSQFEEADQ